jgi:hypothetical protein
LIPTERAAEFAMFGERGIVRAWRDPATVGSFISAATAEPVAKRLVSHPEVAAAAASLGFSALSIDGHELPVMAIEPRKGSLPPAVVEGREPRSPDEVALGSITLRSLGKQVGDSVIVAGPWGMQRARVVGRAVLNHGGWDMGITPGKGGIVHPAFLRRLPIACLARDIPGPPRSRS